MQTPSSPSPPKELNKWLIGCLVALLVFGALVAIGIFLTINSAKWVYQEVTQGFEAPTTQNEAPILNTSEAHLADVSLKRLGQELKQAPLETAKKYRETVLRIQGQIRLEQAFPFNLPVDYFSITSEDAPNTYLFCGVSETYKANIASLQPGSRISIKGKLRDVSDEAQLSILFWPCVFENQNEQ